MLPKKPTRVEIHRVVYGEMIDALDKEIVQKIMNDPNCEESRLLNMRVEAEISRRIELPTVESH